MSVATRTIDRLKNEAKLPGADGQPWRWYHGAIFYVVVQGLTFGLTALVSTLAGTRASNARNIIGDVDYFRRLRQSVFSPPSWAFGPAWTLNNLSVIWGPLRVLNKPQDTPGRSAYLGLQAATWLDFVLFNAGYFSLRSPINAFGMTVLFFLLTIASGFVAIFRLKDSRVALSLATLFIWLIIASTAATFQMLWNRDELYKVGPFVEPNEGLLKKEVK